MDPKGNKPRAREKHVTDQGGGNAFIHGEGLGGGPVGSADGYESRKKKRPSGQSSPNDISMEGGGAFANPNVKRAAIGGALLIPIIIVAVILLVKFSGSSGGGLASLLGGSTPPSGLGGGAQQQGGYSQNSDIPVDNTVASGSRAKRTQILGGGKDKITIMVFMCGTDLESKHGMATNDLSEMAKSDLGDNVNIIVYTGGCNNWKTNGISTRVNQIYQVQKGGLKLLVEDDGSKPMVQPDTLSNFIRYCAKNFPANRNELIFWDHGGGSVTGYGYDEKYKSGGSMDLSEINKALKDGGVKFDFVGFDACLMATAETALMLNEHADYMIASEETEPGIGWYYTNWLTKLSKDTSMPTVDIGKNIVDDFITTCASQCRGQQTTLSVIDLAEFANTVPSKISGFSKSVSKLISDKEYKTVSDARYATREFAGGSRIDQVDFVHLAENLKTEEGKELAKALKGAVKYNRTSSNMTNAYGVSIYFPYQRTSMVDSAVSTYNAIGMDSEYSKCIREFASLETGGQIAAQGASNPLASLLGGFSGGCSGDSGAISSLLSSFLGGSGKSIPELDGSNTDFMKDLDQSSAAEYFAGNYFNTENLKWQKTEDDQYYLDIPDEQWGYVHKLDLNMFLDNGQGYIDLGLDNVYQFSDNKLIADTSRNWLSVNGQIVAYYHTDSTEDGSRYTHNGYIPALLNGERVKLLVVFDSEHPAGYITGTVSDYKDDKEIKTIAKSTAGLTVGDTLQFICDYYSYEKEYINIFKLGNPVTVSENMTLANAPIGDGKIKITYRFTDIYNQEYWSEAIDK